MRCASSRTIAGSGSISGAETDMPLTRFSPGISWWKLMWKTSADFKYPLTACVDCGLVWSEVEPQELREIIAKGGSEYVKQGLGL
jgi:hypothetical protein